jgi:exopolyphosphatase/guanosine-5'-triphosphate,3'-diphosphate pyrophosphatase
MHHGRYDSATVHGATVTRDQARAILERVRRLPLRERREVAGLHPDRAPAIVAGLCIAVGVMEADRAESVTVSERDLLDGAVLRLTERAR